jgi:type VI secretion system protein ImpL
VRRIYYNRFHQAMFGQTQKEILAFLQRLPAAPAPTDEYSPAYFALRAYLITTSEYKRSTLDFTSPYLRNRWLAGREIDKERGDLAKRQWDFYSTDLPLANPYSTENDAIAIDRARRYLAQFSGLERIYQFMLAEASKTNPAVNFNRMFAGSAEVVINDRDVQGAFTKKGWAWMMDALKKADQFLPGERWVLGDYAGPPVDRAKLEQELSERYSSDFIAAWRQYLKNSLVVRYGNLRDAANKLNKTSSNQSPLLALFWLASNNTNVDSPKVKAAFDAVHKVVPPSEAMQFIGPTNTNYMNALVTLQAGLDQAASAPGGPDPAAAAATMSQASSAKIATRQLAQSFRLDPEANVHGTVQKLMEDPITHAEALLRGVGPGEMNQKARALCAGFGIVNKFPFNPTAIPEVTLPELAAIFRPREGSLWTFYEANLKNFLQKQGSQFVPAPGAPFPLEPAFVRFFNQAAAFSEALYPNNSPEPRYSYSLKPLPSDQLQSVTLTIDNQAATFTAQTPARRYVWPSYQLKLSVKVAGGSEFGLHDWQGLWSAFRFFVDADQVSQSGGGYVLTFQPTQGRSNTPMVVVGRPLVYRFQVDTGGAPAIFSKDFLASLKCVSQAAR